MSEAGPDDRERLRGAALELAVERGYQALDAVAIAERAGLDSGAIQRNYTDLEDCLLDTYRAASSPMLAQLRAAVEAEPSWLEGMRALGYAMIDYLRTDERRARFLVVEVVAGGERIRLARETDLATICELIDRGRAERSDPEALGPDTAVAVAGAIFLRAYQGMLKGELGEADRLVPEMMHTLVLPYLGERAARAELERAPRPGSGPSAAAAGS